MWFASAREGWTGVNQFIAEGEGASWSHWRYAGDRLMRELEVGELDLVGDTLFFHSARAGGQGGLDLWRTVRAAGSWS